MSEFRRWVGGRGVSYAVAPEVGAAMRGMKPTASIVVEPLGSGEDLQSSPECQREVSLQGSVVTGLQGRDARGRLLPGPPRAEAAEDERLTADEVRERMRALIAQSPRGSLGGLARACGYRSSPRASLRTAVSGRGRLLETSRRRISRVLQQIERGELVCVEVVGKRRGAYPVYVWEHRERPRRGPASINARKAEAPRDPKATSEGR